MKIFNIAKNGYKFNRLLFLGVIFIFTGIFIYNLMINGITQHPYFTCKSDICFNAVYANKISCNSIYCPPVECKEDWCFQEYVSKGTYGIQPSFTQRYFPMLIWGSTVLAFIINHFLYNKGKKFSLYTKRQILPIWMANIIKKYNPKFENEFGLEILKIEDEPKEKEEE